MTSSHYRLATFASLLAWLGPASAFAQVGDFDADGDVDNYDLTLVLNEYGITVGGNPFIGDADTDGDVDAGDFLLARLNFTSSSASFGSAGSVTQAVAPATLIYNPANGALSLDQTNAQDGRITSFILESSGGFDVVNPINWPFPNDPVAGNLATRTSSVIAQTNPDALSSPSAFGSNPHSLGNLLPPGLTLAGLQGLGLRGFYVGAVLDNLGVPYEPIDARLHPFDYAVVPEPASASLALVAAAAWLRRRTKSAA